VVIVTRKHLVQACSRHKDAAREIAAWVAIVSQARWKSFAEVRAAFPDADLVDGYVVFNLRHNRYRLITVIHCSKKLRDRVRHGHVYVRSFLTHSAYSNRKIWDKEFGR
jgi:mRNA interferase HigB